MSEVKANRWLRSLRSRILLLALLVCALLAAAVAGFFLLLKQTQSARIADASTNLVAVVNTFASDYLAVAGNHVDDPLSRLALPPGPEADRRLSEFTVRALRREPGIEGGFYSAATDSLQGYAFPSNDGPGPKRDLPPRERPTILAVAQQAVATGKPASSLFRGQEDVLLFQAVPLQEHGSTVGSVWAMHRIHNANAGRDASTLLGLISLALAALGCAGIAFWITRSVQSDVATIQRRLEDLQRDLGEPSRGAVSAAELNAVLRGINTLGLSLQQKIAEERALVEQLHHKERLASLGQVAAGVAHELRNPLATIRLRAQMSLRSKDAEQLDRSARLILEEIDRLSSVLDRLLSFAKPIQLQLQSFDVDRMCNDLTDTLAPEAECLGIRLMPGELSAGTLTADPWKLRQVLENLLRNAMECFDGFDRDDRQVMLSARCTSNRIVFAVRDNGPGFPAGAAAQVFDPFFTTKARGTGLGLSIAKEIVRAHGGELELKAATGGGTLAEVRLPRDSQNADGGGLK